MTVLIGFSQRLNQRQSLRPDPATAAKHQQKAEENQPSIGVGTGWLQHRLAGTQIDIHTLTNAENLNPFIVNVLIARGKWLGFEQFLLDITLSQQQRYRPVRADVLEQNAGYPYRNPADWHKTLNQASG